MSPLEAAILRTVAYFDLFAYPLTAWEVWKWGWGEAKEPYSYRAVEQALDSSDVLQEKIACQSGFVFLKGRGELVATRQERYRLALRKFKKAKSFTRVLAQLPFVRAVAVCNSLGTANARAESDIDLFIITKPGHVWTTRLLAAGYAQLRKLRPQVGDRADKVCLSFFLTVDALNLADIRKTDDPYLTMWLATLAPLYDPHGLLPSLWSANPWLANALPNAVWRTPAEQREVKASAAQSLLETLFGGASFEHWAERFQQRRLPPNLRALANRDTRVILNNQMLKFHDNDRRDEYAQRFQAQLATLGL